MCRASVGKRIEITERDLELLKLLARYRYLRSNFLHAFLGGASEKRFKERLGHLYHDARLINRPGQQWQFANCRYMPAVYELDEAGARVLRDCGQDFVPARVARPSRQFAHTLMVSEALASIELGARASRGLRFISAHEVLSKAPERTGKTRHPFELPVSISCAGAGGKAQRAEFRLVPDAVFGLEYPGKTYRFFALEADRNTMPCTRSDLRQSSFIKKLLAYRAVAAQQLHRTFLGVPNLLVLVVTTDETHMQNLMTAVTDQIGGSTMFLFKATPQVGNVLRAPTPSPQLLREPWQRVGHSPMAIAQD